MTDERMVMAFAPDEDRSVRLLVRGAVDELVLDALTFWLEYHRLRLSRIGTSSGTGANGSDSVENVDSRKRDA